MEEIIMEDRVRPPGSTPTWQFEEVNPEAIGAEHIIRGLAEARLNDAGIAAYTVYVPAGPIAGADGPTFKVLSEEVAAKEAERSLQTDNTQHIKRRAQVLGGLTLISALYTLFLMQKKQPLKRQLIAAGATLVLESSSLACWTVARRQQSAADELHAQANSDLNTLDAAIEQFYRALDEPIGEFALMESMDERELNDLRDCLEHIEQFNQEALAKGAWQIPGRVATTLRLCPALGNQPPEE